MSSMLASLRGALLSETTWTGRLKLESLFLPAAEQREALTQLVQVPGVEYQDRPLKSSPVGWYIPRDIIELGQHLALLGEYPPDPSDKTPSGRQLQCHQARGVTFIRRCTSENEGVILGAAVGCGKTTTVLQASMLDGYLTQPALIIGTNTSRAAWVGETADPWKHYRQLITPLFSETPDPTVFAANKPPWFFIHYDILPFWQPLIFSELRPELLIIDESHALAHAQSRQSKAALAISRASYIERRVLLTGTPIPNRRPNLWHQLAVARPRQWGWTSELFERRYCGMYLGGANEQGDEIRCYDEARVLPEHLVELQARLAGTLLRYEKEQADGSIPQLVVHQHRIPLEDAEVREKYNAAIRDTPAYLRAAGAAPDETITVRLGDTEVKLTKKDMAQGGGTVKIVCLNILIGILSEYKAKQSAPLVLDLFLTRGYVVAFTWRRNGAKALVDTLRADGSVMTKPIVYGPMDGTMAQADRQVMATEFARTGGILVATMGAAGESINELAVSPVGVAVDLHWQPKTVVQMVGRLQRMNSPHKQIDMHFVVCKNTFDEELVTQLVDKIISAGATMPGETAGNYLVDLSPDRSIEPLDIDAVFAAFAGEMRED